MWHNTSTVAEFPSAWHNPLDMAASDVVEVTLRPQGRLVVPAALRRRLGIATGDILIARAEDGRLVLERRDAVLARMRGRFAAVPADVSLVDDLLAERRSEVDRER